jgi:hypothetical protein
MFIYSCLSFISSFSLSFVIHSFFSLFSVLLLFSYFFLFCLTTIGLYYDSTKWYELANTKVLPRYLWYKVQD